MTNYNIVFQGCSIDGWMSAFLAGMLIAKSAEDNIYFHPIDSRTPSTWPPVEKLAPPPTAAAPASAPIERQTAATNNGKGYCFFIDCCPTSCEYLLDIRKEFNMVVFDNNPATAEFKSCEPAFLIMNDVSKTTISQVMEHFEMRTAAVPSWVAQVDRIESWTMTGDDAAVRENLLEICRLPTMGYIEEALAATSEYLAIWDDAALYKEFVARGQKKLAEKTASYTDILAKVRRVTLTPGKWGLPASWAGRTFLYVDTSGSAPDSSELATIALAGSGADAFVNFRKRKGFGPDGRPVWHYVYSARRAAGSDIDLVAAGSPFKGYNKSAGGVVPSTAMPIPFVSY
jgi:hypothetical protein